LTKDDELHEFNWPRHACHSIGRDELVADRLFFTPAAVEEMDRVRM
jgi:hypothetical protein